MIFHSQPEKCFGASLVRLRQMYRANAGAACLLAANRLDDIGDDAWRLAGNGGDFLVRRAVEDEAEQAKLHSVPSYKPAAKVGKRSDGLKVPGQKVVKNNQRR